MDQIRHVATLGIRFLPATICPSWLQKRRALSMPFLYCQLRAIEEAEKREKELRMREELEFRAQKVRERTLHMLDRPRSATVDNLL